MGEKEKEKNKQSPAGQPETEPQEESAEKNQQQEDAQEQPEAEAPAAAEKSETELLQEKVESLNDKLLRTMAEYDNFRKRSQREKEAIYPQATAAAVSQFVTILDTFDRAMKAPCSDPEFKKGVEMILQNFMEALRKLGVEEFGAEGDTFDPAFHNAVMHVEDDSDRQSVILEVFQKGYRLGDRVIRHAMVKVVN